MCGIAGLIDFQKRIDNPKALVTKMCQAMVHRGPDAQGIQHLDEVTFGHRRLSIIDTHQSANQPMGDASGQFLVTFNGELYNYQEIRRILEEKGHVFRTQSDTEVLVEAWAAWGVEALQKFVGMFAFALWDRREKALYLVRDRLGEKPLFYGYLDPKNPQKGLVFASSLSALMASTLFEKELNSKALEQFLSLNYTLTSQCFYQGISKLPAAHYLRMQVGKDPQIHSYWDLATSFKNKRTNLSEHQALEEFAYLFSTSIKGQMISDVPFGAFLSGGIDSSAIVATMTREAVDSAHVQTFSIGFQEKSYSEIVESQTVARHLLVDHHVKVVTPDLATGLVEMMAKTDEPFADTSLMPTYYLSKFARETVTVALSGDGGDELFLGYETYSADRLYQKLSWVPRGFFKAGYGLVNSFMPPSFNKVSFDYKLKQFLYGSSFDFRRAHFSWREIFKASDIDALLGRDPSTKPPLALRDFDAYFDDVKDCHPLDQASYVDLKTWLVDDILVKVDRASMAHSLETRAPFLDHRLVEFAARLPVDLKLKGQQKKYLLKKSQESYLPHETLYRAKKGFNAPVSHWLQGEMKSMAKDAMYSSKMQGLTQRSVLDKLWQEHDSKTKDHGLKLFGLTCLGLWLEQGK